MRVTGQVIKQKERFAYVRSARPESCEHCANSGICNKKEVEICAYNDIGAQIGDYVTVETNEDKTAPLILAYLFLTPLGILFLSYYLYTQLPWLALMAIPLTAVYYIVLRRINKNHPVRARIVSPALLPKDCAELRNEADR
jgi:positive regulator of sigma E activity